MAAHSRDETFPDTDAASGINDGNSVVANDDPQVGDVASVLGRGQRDLAKMHVIAISDLLNTEWRERGSVSQWEAEDQNGLCQRSESVQSIRS